MKVRDYSDTAGPGARKVDRPGGPQKRIDLTPTSGRSRCGAPTMTLPTRSRPPKHLHQAVRQLDSSGRYVGAQEGIREHAERTKAAQFLERPASCSRFRTFPSWTSPVRPRSPALEKAPTSHGLPRFSVRSPVGEPA